MREELEEWERLEPCCEPENRGSRKGLWMEQSLGRQGSYSGRILLDLGS